MRKFNHERAFKMTLDALYIAGGVVVLVLLIYNAEN